MAGVAPLRLLSARRAAQVSPEPGARVPDEVAGAVREWRKEGPLTRVCESEALAEGTGASCMSLAAVPSRHTDGEGARLLLCGNMNMSITSCDSATGHVDRMPLSEPASAAVWCLASFRCRDGAWRVVAGYNNAVVTLWDATSGQLLRDSMSHRDMVLCAAPLPDTSHYVTGSFDRSALVWRTQVSDKEDENTCVAAVLMHPHPVHSLATFTDPRSGDACVVTGASDGRLRVFRALTSRVIANWRAHDVLIAAVAVVPRAHGGMHIASAGHNGVLCLWHAETHTMLARVRTSAMPLLTTLLSPSGTACVASADTLGRLQLWSADTLQRIGHPLHAHPEQRISALTSFVGTDGRWHIATASGNKLRVWRA